MNKQNSSTSRRIDRLLRSSHLKRVDLAKYLGLARSTISQKMKGTTRWTLRDISRIADYFEVSIDYLTGRGSL